MDAFVRAIGNRGRDIRYSEIYNYVENMIAKSRK
jgi:hypothetical protein